MPRGNPRDRSIRVAATTEELEMLHRLAEDAGITASDLIRMFVRREHAARFGEGRKTKAKR